MTDENIIPTSCSASPVHDDIDIMQHCLQRQTWWSFISTVYTRYSQSQPQPYIDTFPACTTGHPNPVPTRFPHTDRNNSAHTD